MKRREKGSPLALTKMWFCDVRTLSRYSTRYSTWVYKTKAPFPLSIHSILVFTQEFISLSRKFLQKPNLKYVWTW